MTINQVQKLLGEYSGIVNVCEIGKDFSLPLEPMLLACYEILTKYMNEDSAQGDVLRERVLGKKSMDIVACDCRIGRSTAYREYRHICERIAKELSLLGKPFEKWCRSTFPAVIIT